MSQPQEMGGLFGALRNAAKSSTGTVKAGFGFFSRPELWAVRLAAFAGVVAIYVKSGAPTFGFEPVAFALAIGLSGLMFEASSAKNIVRSAWEGRMFGIAIWSALWIAAFSYSAFNWVSVAAENESEKTNLHQAAAFATQDVRGEVQEAGAAVLAARAKVENLRKAAWESIPVVAGQQITTEGQALALIDKAKSDRFWKRTDGCTMTKGKDTSRFCAEYRDAVAALADVQKRVVIQEEFRDAETAMKEAESRHASAKKVASTTKVESRTVRADVELIGGFFGFEGDNKEAKVEQAMAVFKILAVSVFLSLGAMMLEIEKLRETTARKPFGIMARLNHVFRLIAWAFTGGTKPVYQTPTVGRSGPTYSQHTNITIADDAVAKQIQELAKQFADRKAFA